MRFFQHILGTKKTLNPVSNKPVLMPRRRAFLLALGAGGVALAAAQVWRSRWNPYYRPEVLSETVFENFKLVETTRDMTLYDKVGDEVIVFEKD